MQDRFTCIGAREEAKHTWAKAEDARNSSSHLSVLKQTARSKVPERQTRDYQKQFD